MNKAIEIIGEQHFPTDAEKLQVHELIEDLATRLLPPAFFYHNTEMAPHDDYGIHTEKLLPKNWELLQEMDMAGELPVRGRIPLREKCGLSVMSLLADCCAGSTRARITDRGAAYAGVVGLLSDQAKGIIAEPEGSLERLVPISLSIVNVRTIDLSRLIAFRQREEQAGGHAIRDLRHRYVDRLEAYAKRLVNASVGKGDEGEIERQFEIDMKDDLAHLRDELGYNKSDTFFSKEVFGTVVATGLSLAVAKYGVPLEFPGTASWVGVPALISGGILLKNKFASARRSVLQRHPMAYLYELSTR